MKPTCSKAGDHIGEMHKPASGEKHNNTNKRNNKNKTVAGANKDNEDHKQDSRRHGKDNTCLNGQADDKTKTISQTTDKNKCEQSADGDQQCHGHENRGIDHVALVPGLAGRSPERRLARGKGEEADKTQAEGHMCSNIGSGGFLRKLSISKN
jgi:hypothetical protein